MQTNWLQFRPGTLVGKNTAYIDLPAFSYTNPTWAGASELVAQFNFSANSNFYLTTIAAKPNAANFGLCIKYRVGETVFRYKLWNFDGLHTAPLYTNQLIKKNFVLEIWTIQGQVSSVLLDTFRLITSVRSVPSSPWSVSDYALATGTAHQTYFAIPELSLPATNLRIRWVADDLADGAITDWPANNDPSFILSGNATKASGGSTFNGKGYVNFNGTTDELSGIILSPATQEMALWIVCSIQSFPGMLRGIFRTDNTYGSRCGLTILNSTQLAQSLDSSVGDGVDYSLDTVAVFETRWNRPNNVGTTCYTNLNKNFESAVSGILTGTYPVIGQDFAFGKGGPVDYKTPCRIAEFISYLGSQTESDREKVRNYLFYNYQEISLPLDLPEYVAWLDNT